MTVPVYIHVENEAEVLHLMDEIKQGLLEAAQILSELHNIRLDESASMQLVQGSIQQLQTKLAVLEEELYV